MERFDVSQRVVGLTVVALGTSLPEIGAAVIAPFVEFFRRNGRFAIVLLALILTFNISDRVLGIMANPFYLDVGFSKSEIASVAKIFGFDSVEALEADWVEFIKSTKFK